MENNNKKTSSGGGGGGGSEKVSKNDDNTNDQTQRQHSKTMKQGAKKSVDVAKGTKRRVDAAISLRQKNRLEQLSKKRKESDESGLANANNNNTTSASGGSNNNEGIETNEDLGQQNPDPNSPYNQETFEMFSRIPEYVAMCDPNNEIDQVSTGVAAIRRMLCHPEENPVRGLVRHGGLERLVQCLDAPEPGIQFNAAWSLTNISSQTHSHAALIINLGAIPKFINFLSCPVEKLREQSAWCLGNMAGDGQPIRDQILNAGVMDPLLTCLNGENENIATLRNACWLLAQLCRNKPSPAFELVEPALPTIRRLLEHPVTEIQDDACWAVSYISDGPPSRINAVISYDVMPLVLELLKSQRPSVMLPSVRTFGNFSATNPEMTQIIIDQGVLNLLPPLLHRDISRQIRKEVAWLISNACAGYDEQVTAVIEAGLFPPVVENMYASEFEVRRESVWVVANATATASVDRIRFLVEDCEVLGGLCNVLGTMDSRICNIALESIEAILLVGDQFRINNNGRNPYADHVESIGGKDNIGRLRDHICHTVFLRSATLMDRYFDDEREWDPNEIDDESYRREGGYDRDSSSGNNNNAGGAGTMHNFLSSMNDTIYNNNTNNNSGNNNNDNVPQGGGKTQQHQDPNKKGGGWSF